MTINLQIKNIVIIVEQPSSIMCNDKKKNATVTITPPPLIYDGHQQQNWSA